MISHQNYLFWDLINWMVSKHCACASKTQAFSFIWKILSDSHQLYMGHHCFQNTSNYSFRNYFPRWSQVVQIHFFPCLAGCQKVKFPFSISKTLVIHYFRFPSSLLSHATSRIFVSYIGESTISTPLQYQTFSILLREAPLSKLTIQFSVTNLHPDFASVPLVTSVSSTDISLVHVLTNSSTYLHYSSTYNFP